MREHVDPPVSFGGSGGIIWSLGPNALSQIPATRRPRTDPSAPSALRLCASGPAETLVECGRRVDPREWADPPPGLELAGPDLLALPEIDRRETETEDEDDGDAGFADHCLSLEATEAQAALDAATAFPVGVPKRALQARLRESKRAAWEADDPRRGGRSSRRLGNALAVAPWPRDGRSEGPPTSAPDVMLARAAGEGATRVRIARLAREVTTHHARASSGGGATEPSRRSAPAPSRLRAAADFPLPTRSASQPVLQVELARVSHGWFDRFADDAQPALCATRDPYGVSLCVLGGGARAVPVPGRKKKKPPGRTVSSARESPVDPSPSPELLWSCAWNGPASAPAHVALSPHGLPELLVASRDGGLRVVDAAACDAAGGAKRMKKTKRALRRAARVAATPAATREGVDAFFGAGSSFERGWCGCTYTSSPRVALLATSRLVRSVDLREKPNAGTFLAEPLAGDAPWRALAGPPVAAWSPSSFSFGSHDTHATASSDGVLSNAFALACDKHVALYDIRKPDAPVARWAHGAASSPAWLRLEPSAPWRFLFSPSSSPGALVLAGHGGEDGGVLAFEWVDLPGEALDGSLSGGVRALGAGARVPLAEDDSTDSAEAPCGFATLPPAFSPSGFVSGATLWATRGGRVRWRAYEPESPASTDTEHAVSPTAPLAFRADGKSVSRADGEDGDGETRVSPRDSAEPFSTRTTDPPPGMLDATDPEISPELARALGAAAGVAAMDPPRVSLREMDDAARRACDAATARAAALGAASAAAAAAGRGDGASFFAGHQPEDGGRVVKKKTTFPLVGGFIVRGAIPGETPARVDDSGGGTGAPETGPAAKAGGENEVLARAAALVRDAGGFSVTAHELAHLAACARGDGGGAADVAEWVASRDLFGRKRSRTQAPDADAKARARRDAETFAASAFVPRREEAGEGEAPLASDEDVPTTLVRTRVDLGRAFPCVRHPDDARRDDTNDRVRPSEGDETTRGDASALAAVVGANDGDADALRARDAPHTEWLRTSARWVGACARTTGRTTYALRPSRTPLSSPLRPEVGGDGVAKRAEASNAARAALLASWPDPSSARGDARGGGGARARAAETTTLAAVGSERRGPFPGRLESRLKPKTKRPRGAAPTLVPRETSARRVSWDVPPASPRAPAATPRTEPKKNRRTENKARATRRAGF